MKISRVLAGSAAAAVMVLVPQAAFAVDYGQPARRWRRWATEAAPWATEAARWATRAARSARVGSGSGSGLPSTGSGALDSAIGGAGLLLLVGGGALVVASRRKELETA